MAYSDLLTDAVIYAPLNNSMALTTTGTATQVSWDGSHVFVNDAPAATGNTHSLQWNSYSSDPGKYEFADLPGVSNAISVTGWIKFVTDPNINYGDSVGSSVTVFTLEQQFSSTSYFRIMGGTYSNVQTSSLATDRRMHVLWHQGTTNQSSTTTYSNTKIPLNEWVHIAMVLQNPGAIGSSEYQEIALYINGVCVNYQFTSTALHRLNFNYMTFPIINLSDTTTKLGSNFAFWHRALTIEEIREQAWYGHDNEDYNSVVLADNPTYYATLDNPDKNTDHTVYGATDWGSLSDDVDGIFVNELGPNNSKAWRLSSTSNYLQNRTVNSDPEMMQGISDLYKSGEFSIEFWFKNSIKPPSTRHLLGIVANTGINNSVGAFFFEMDNTARITYRGSYKNGATSYISGSVLGTQIDTPTTGQEILTLHPGTGVTGFGDNKWHHVIYTHSNTEALGSITAGATTYTGQLYVDGCKVGERNWTTTYGWLDGTGTADGFHIGPSTSSLTLGDGYISNIAFYPYRLPFEKVQNHFKVGLDFVSQYGAIKYYDGSAWQLASAAKTWDGNNWVDWNKKYYDGTQWVTF